MLLLGRRNMWKWLFTRYRQGTGKAVLETEKIGVAIMSKPHPQGPRLSITI